MNVGSKFKFFGTFCLVLFLQRNVGYNWYAKKEKTGNEEQITLQHVAAKAGLTVDRCLPLCQHPRSGLIFVVSLRRPWVGNSSLGFV
jgi:hypothetical protein